MEPQPSSHDPAAGQLLAGGDQVLDLDRVAGLLTTWPADERFQPLVDALLTGSPEQTATAAMELEPAVWTPTARASTVQLLREAGLGRLAADACLGRAMVYRAALRAVVCAGAHREYVAEVEKEMARVPPSQHRHLALQLAPTAIPAAWLPLDAVEQDAGAYIQSFPLPGRVIMDVVAACARWLSIRWDAPHRRVGARRGLLVIGGAWPESFPLASRALLALAAEAIPEIPDQDEPWVHLMRGIAMRQMEGDA